MSPMHVATEIIASEPSRAARAPTDVLRLAVAVGSLLVVVLIGALFDEAIVGFVADLVQGIEALPSWLVTAVIVIGQVLGVVVIVGGAVVAVVRRNWILLASPRPRPRWPCCSRWSSCRSSTTSIRRWPRSTSPTPGRP